MASVGRGRDYGSGSTVDFADGGPGLGVEEVGHCSNIDKEVVNNVSLIITKSNE